MTACGGSSVANRHDRRRPRRARSRGVRFSERAAGERRVRDDQEAVAGVEVRRAPVDRDHAALALVGDDVVAELERLLEQQEEARRAREPTAFCSARPMTIDPMPSAVNRPPTSAPQIQPNSTARLTTMSTTRAMSTKIDGSRLRQVPCSRGHEDGEVEAVEQDQDHQEAERRRGDLRPGESVAVSACGICVNRMMTARRGARARCGRAARSSRRACPCACIAGCTSPSTSSTIGRPTITATAGQNQGSSEKIVGDHVLVASTAFGSMRQTRWSPVLVSTTPDVGERQVVGELVDDRAASRRARARSRRPAAGRRG